MRRFLIDRAGALGTPLLAVALVAALALAAAYSRADDSVLTSSRKGSFTIKGHVLGLYPGRTATLRLTIRNKNRFAIRVKSIRVRVGNAPACPRSNLVVKSFRGSLRVAAKRKRRIALPISMRRTAPDGCMGARLPLRYTGKAVKG
jgi:hypothetical protein